MNHDLRSLIGIAAVEHKVDILLLAESGVPDREMIAALKAATSHEYAALSDDNDKVRIFTRLPVVNWRKR